MSRRLGGFVAALLASATPVVGQGLDRRVAGAPEGNVQFHFAARPGVCGNGAGLLRTGDGSSYYTSFASDVGQAESCTAGPVRVVVVRIGREIVKFETFAGPLAATPESGADLGPVPARDAAAWLLAQATALEGRPAREAILPAMLADSAVVTPTLATIARDTERSRDLRRSAISWLARRRAEPGGIGHAAAARLLDDLVRDRSENESIRSTALSTIASLDRGEGVSAMIGFAAESDPWLSRQAWASLARSGDPRARQFTREGVRRTELGDDLRVLAIQGIGGEYATGADYRLLRELYSSLDSDRTRDAVVNALGTAGGRDNVNWLLTLAESKTEPAARRRRVVSLLGRLDEPRIREALRGMAER
ncbi:MAG: HEAT repeat domain-containing protein [Gemmatimonadales bacterium]|nr:HEAT repeat domain-containing protein [Gemmatimonadales bacterium]